MEEKLTLNGLDEKKFLAKYNHNLSGVEEVGLDWNQLVSIYTRHLGSFDILNRIADGIHKLFRDIPGAYIVRYRVKDPEHLIDKIIRKNTNQKLEVNEDNYIDVFDDLIGFRILHLFKNDWKSIHQYLTENFEQNEQPVVYYRKGDSPEFLKGCEEMGIKPVERQAGYRSIHYVNKYDALGRTLTYEVQVRTVIEDAWSEIDHLVRYPNNTDNELINRYLLMFNAFAGAADEMGTFLMYFKQNMNAIDSENVKRQEEMSNTILELQKEISSLRGTNAVQKDKINQLVEKLNSGISYLPPQIPDYQIPSFADVLSASHSPSITNPFDRLDKLRSTIEENLSKAKTIGQNPYLGIVPEFEMPKPGAPLPNIEDYVWPGMPKKKKK